MIELSENLSYIDNRVLPAVLTEVETSVKACVHVFVLN